MRAIISADAFCSSMPENSISGVWRTALRHMRIGARIVISRAADASRVQNQRAGWQLDQVPLVAMTAEDNTSVNISQPSLDNGQWCPNKPVF